MEPPTSPSPEESSPEPSPKSPRQRPFGYIPLTEKELGEGAHAIEIRVPPPEGYQPPQPPPQPRRRLLLPICLLAATALSTFWAGVAKEYAPEIIFGGEKVAELLARNWPASLYDGLKYMAAIMGILLAHEMGHFLFTLWHRIPASFPLFIPFPFSPFGTMGAVIAMQGSRADRRQLFDIGIAGPIAGLFVAIPVTCAGIMIATEGQSLLTYHHPLLVKLLIAVLRPDLQGVSVAMNPMLMAGWVGLLVTGLNMLPMSQLDGGHVTYALFTKKAHIVARVFLLLAGLFCATIILTTGRYTWVPMLVLITLIGVDHPPTADDTAPLGKGRIALGYGSLIIPILCFPPMGIS